MKNKLHLLKKVLAAFMCIVMLLIQATPAYAYKSVEENLVNRGYPQGLIDLMPNEEKEDLIQNNCFFESAKTYNYNENGDVISCISFNKKSGAANYGQIKPTHLSLTITTSKSGSNTVVTFHYNWKTLPLNRYQDPMCIGWDDSIFTYKSGSFRKVDKYKYVIDDGSGVNVYEGVHSDVNTYANSSFSYVTWYADLKGYTTNVTNLYGYGTLTLVPKKTGKTTQILGHYIHKKLDLGVSLTYGPAGFNVSGSSGYDEMGTDTSVRS